jgi:hypothetical protein
MEVVKIEIISLREFTIPFEICETLGLNNRGTI